MTTEPHQFDPSTYDARSVHKPLSQLMREADADRAEATAEMLAGAWRRLKRLFTGARKEPWQKEAEEDTRLAA